VPAAAAAEAADAAALHTGLCHLIGSVAATASPAAALEFHPKHEKRQNLRQNEKHYENITH
jgi:hypothetical protein